MTERGVVIARLVPAQATAALVELLRPEPESERLADWLDERMDTLLVTSTLTDVELPRALRRIDPTLLAGIPALLERLARHEIDNVVRAAAAAYRRWTPSTSPPPKSCSDRASPGS